MRVAVTGLRKRFPGAPGAAIDNVSFTAPAGGITALLGPSGSGKSTVLRVIAGLELADQGRVSIGERDVSHLPPRERQVGFVFQSYALFDNMSVADNVAFGLELQRRPKAQIEARVRELLALVQLDGLATRKPAQLSGGQRQRVAFARSLAPEPSVLLLDEPFGALDTHVRVELRRWLHELHERTSVTTLLVTHDQEEALELAQHVVLLKDGAVEQAGAPHELYDHPRTPFVASFLGGATVLRGRVGEGNTWLGGSIRDAPPDAEDGELVTACVRPHDVVLTRPEGAAATSTLGKIQRLVRVGGYVRITLELEDGSLLEAELTHAEVQRLGLALGERVGFDFARTRLFAEDYAI